MIHVLPPHIASQIAAGEVVQRPASVVKELLENAVDSGADRIDLILADAGSTLMQVVDNGCGMSSEDALLAFERHATSKIHDIEDLQRVNTFGFRGEALASIASVAHVRLRTRRNEDETGTEITIAGSAVTSQEEAACPAGSDFSVRNLFFNVPARRKFLKSESAEFRHILQEFYRVALCHPEITFTLTHNDKQMYLLPACDSLRSRIGATLGKDIGNQLVDINVNTSLIRIGGYVGRPQDARKTGGNQYFFVNHRFFRSSYLHKAILSAYEKLLPEGRFPSYFIYFETDPGSIDVNIHPAKIEVKFQDEQILFRMLQAVVREALGKFALAPSIDFDLGGMQHDIPVPLHTGQYVPPPRPDYDPLFNPFFPDKTKASEPVQEQFPDTPVLEEQVLGELNGSYRQVPVLKVRNKYLVTSVASGLLVVHKRRAWERIFYEELLPLFGDRALSVHKLLFPVALNLQPPEAIFIKENSQKLLRLGFETDENGFVTGVPADHPTDRTSVQTSLEEIMEWLEQGIPDGQENFRIAAILARRKACSNENDPVFEYQSVIDRLFACKEPNYTPSGKPCMTIVPEDQIDKFFV